jgi:hypothetical protein
MAPASEPLVSVARQAMRTRDKKRRQEHEGLERTAAQQSHRQLCA